MPQTATNREVFQRSPSPCGVVSRDPKRRLRMSRTLLKYRSLLLAGRFLNKARICVAAIRSCLGHIRSQSSKGMFLEVGSHGDMDRPEEVAYLTARIDARMQGIENLSATRPWADVVDAQIFLEGFDAGAEWKSRMDI